MILEYAVEAIAADMIKRGVFDDQIAAVIVDTIRSGKDDGLTRIGFILKMAVEIMDRSRPRLSFDAAKKEAGAAFADFLRDSRIKFDDVGYDWSGRGAREVAHTYVIEYFEKPTP
jgi:hypothetical protein